MVRTSFRGRRSLPPAGMSASSIAGLSAAAVAALSTPAVAALVLSTAVSASATQPAPQSSLAGHHLMVDSRYRWLPERAHPDFTPFLTRSTSFSVDSVAVRADGTSYYLRYGTLVVRLDADTTGRLRGTESVSLGTPPAGARQADATLAMRTARNRHMVNDDLWPLEARAWDFSPAPRRPLSAGDAWVDTLALHATGAPGQEYRLRGERHARVERDTVVDGQRMWLVRDSTALELEERWPVFRDSWGDDVVIERRARGVSLRRLILDPALGAAAELRDSTVLHGTTTWHLPDGHTETSPTRFELVTTARLLDPEAATAVLRARTQERRSQFGGHVLVPGNALEERFAAGDTALADSVLMALSGATDPMSRRRLIAHLQGPEARVPGLDAVLFRRALESGDTVQAFFLAQSALSGAARPLDSPRAELLVDLLADRAALAGLGLNPDPAYNALAGRLFAWPPALASETGRAACSPEACALLAAAWDRDDVDPRLRDVALLTRFTLSPAEWYDTLVARAPAGTPIVEQALRFAHIEDVRVRRPIGPLPTADAPWTEWRRWTGGQGGVNPQRQIAARLFRLRTGRDLGQEALVRYRAETGDSARILFGAIAADLRAFPLDAATVAGLLDSGDTIDIAIGRRLLGRLLDDAPPAPDDVQTEVLGTVLAALFENAPLWDGERRLREQLHAVRPDTVFVVRDGLPAALVAAWRDRVAFITLDECRARDPRAATMAFRIETVRQAGEFLRVDWRYDERLDVAPDAVPRHYRGITYYLLRRDGDGSLRVLRRGGWVT